MSLRLAYMTGEYPRATDTFIQREVAALREAGVHVQTMSVRRPHDRENVGPEQHAERQRTRYLLPARLPVLVKSHLKLMARSPAKYFGALRTALFVRPAGLKPLVWQLAYFAEAGLAAGHVIEQKLTHLHNHFSNSSCSVAMLAAQMGGFTFSFTMHGPMEFFEPKYWRIDEKIRRARFVCCISQFCRSQAMIFCEPGVWDRLHIVHCGVDPGQFAPVDRTPFAGRLLFVGRLAGVKGLPILLEAVAEVAKTFPNVELIVAGDGPDRANLERRAADLGITHCVRFVGYQSQAQVRQLLSQTDVFVMASFAEGVPVVLMEAMASGVPVVATRIAGIPELIEDQVSGLLAPPGDPKALAQKIAALLGDRSMGDRFAKAGREKVEAEFNIAIESKALVKILTSALKP